VLRLKSCCLGESGGRSLARDAAPQHHCHVDLGGNGLEEAGGQTLAETLRFNDTLTSLDLSYNDLGEGGGWTLAEALLLNTTVTSLDLVVNYLREGGGLSLAEALCHNTMVTLVNLGINDLREGGAGDWQGHCVSMPRSRRSALADLGEGRGRMLAEALRLNTTVTSLDLHDNDLGDGVGRALAETLRLNTTLTSLNLGSNVLGEGRGRSLVVISGDRW
jgi:Ran GTPase-activating protein (RanGAP) involved in mRNA processing and transport